VLGIDEVGTGALAGPIVSAAVAFQDDEEKLPKAVRDSKALSSAKREALYPLIIESAITWGIGFATPDEIDRWGADRAHIASIVRAFRTAKKKYTGDARLVCVVDGRDLHTKLRDYLGDEAAVFADRADQKSYSVAAASIVAKVTRDAIMRECGKAFPEYGFTTNVGYPSKKHTGALKEFGPIPLLHRFSTKPLKKIIKEREKNGSNEKGI
jgi:ribonuclease HII